MKTATLIKDKLPGFAGHAALYRLSEPLGSDWDEESVKTDLVVVSAAVVTYCGPETYIFAADEDGQIASWSELPGSMKGTLSHAEALEGAGYEVRRA